MEAVVSSTMSHPNVSREMVVLSQAWRMLG